MALDLNNIRAPYQDFRNEKTARRYIDQMPLVIADSRDPIGVAEVFERRLNSGKPDWDNNYVDTGDAVALSASDPDKFKIVRGAPFLRRVTSNTKLLNGSLVLEEGAYAGIAGPEFSREKLGDLLNQDLPLDKIGDHRVWLEILGDKDLLVEYAGRKFAEMKSRFGYDAAMGIYVSGAQDVDTARPLVANGLELRSLVRGGSLLVSDYARLVGVAPEARAGLVVVPTLEQALAVVNRYSGDLDLRRK